MLVVDGEGPDLLNRDWMAALKVTCSVGDVHTVEQERPLQEILAKHASLFTEVPKRDGSETKCQP